MKQFLALGVSLALALTCLAPSAAAEGDSPSPWAAAEVGRAVELGLAPEAVQGNWQGPITRGEFAQLAVRYLAVEHGYEDDAAFVNDYLTYNRDRNGEFWGGEDFGDGLTWWERFSNDDGSFYLTDLPVGEQRGYINAAYFIGVVNGKGDGTVYDPEGAITRQEAACMLARSYEILDPEDHGVTLYSDYTDYGAMAAWAIDDIGTVVGLGVMGSISDTANVFDPLGTYSREQAVVTFLRLYENAPVSRSRENVIPLQEAAYERALYELLNQGDPGTNFVDFRADTEQYTVLALRYRNGMHFGASLVAVYRDGRTRSLWDGSTADWALSADGTTLTFTADGTAQTVSLI